MNNTSINDIAIEKRAAVVASATVGLLKSQVRFKRQRERHRETKAFVTLMSTNQTRVAYFGSGEMAKCNVSPLNTEKMYRRIRPPVVETRPLTDSSERESSKKKASVCSMTTRRAALVFFLTASDCHKAPYDNTQSVQHDS
jgi:hypothetical protein